MSTRLIPILGCAAARCGCQLIIGIEDLDPDDGPIVDASIIDSPGTADAGVDAATDSLAEDVVHVPLACERVTSADLFLDGTHTIDTDTLDITPGGLGEAALVVCLQQTGNGRDLAVLQVNTLTIPYLGEVRVQGYRPLVIVARADVTIDGLLDASGRRDMPGPGGEDSGQGQGAGQIGEMNANTADGGGGGGGHATTGGTGGFGCNGALPCTITENAAYGGLEGDSYNDYEGPLSNSVLLGGSGGGAGTRTSGQCPSGTGGAGGGAVQIYSVTRIEIRENGGINVGGGGGGRASQTGGACGNLGTGGGGGGSGGVIYLQSPEISVQGILASNGGGGGSGGNDNGMAAGTDGGDGSLGDIPAPGGPMRQDFAGAGGDGGANTTQPQSGIDQDQLNAGGGGGAVGFNIARVRSGDGWTVVGGSVISPPPSSGLYRVQAGQNARELH